MLSPYAKFFTYVYKFELLIRACQSELKLQLGEDFSQPRGVTHE